MNWHWASCTHGCRRVRQRVRRYVRACLPWYAGAWPTEPVMLGIHCGLPFHFTDLRLGLCASRLFYYVLTCIKKTEGLYQHLKYFYDGISMISLRTRLEMFQFIQSFLTVSTVQELPGCDMSVTCLYFKFVNTDLPVFGWAFGVKEQRQKGNGSQIPAQHETHEFPW